MEDDESEKESVEDIIAEAELENSKLLRQLKTLQFEKAERLIELESMLRNFRVSQNDQLRSQLEEQNEKLKEYSSRLTILNMNLESGRFEIIEQMKEDLSMDPFLRLRIISILQRIVDSRMMLFERHDSETLDIIKSVNAEETMPNGRLVLANIYRNIHCDAESPCLQKLAERQKELDSTNFSTGINETLIEVKPQTNGEAIKTICECIRK